LDASTIKILTADKDHEILSPVRCDITPPRLGDVSVFALECNKKLKINPDHFFEEKKNDGSQIYFSDQQRNIDILERPVQLMLSKLLIPIWLIVFVVLYIALKLSS
jgi:hypothetical protein